MGVLIYIGITVLVATISLLAFTLKWRTDNAAAISAAEDFQRNGMPEDRNYHSFGYQKRQLLIQKGMSILNTREAGLSDLQIMLKMADESFSSTVGPMGTSIVVAVTWPLSLPLMVLMAIGYGLWKLAIFLAERAYSFNLNVFTTIRKVQSMVDEREEKDEQDSSAGN